MPRAISCNQSLLGKLEKVLTRADDGVVLHSQSVLCLADGVHSKPAWRNISIGASLVTTSSITGGMRDEIDSMRILCLPSSN